MTVAVVTGAAGFIGSRLSEHLLAAGHQVVGVDSLTPYYARAIKEDNLRTLRDNGAFSFHDIDVRELPAEQLLAADAVFHLAAQPGVRPSWVLDSFRTYLDQNVSATHYLLEALRAAGSQAAFVFASSSSVYGEIGGEPVGEERPLRPESPYGVTKLAAESLVRVYGLQFALNTISLRFFTVYGPRQRPDMAMHRFVQSALTGAPVPLYGDGAQERDFTYVDDVARALTAAAERAGELRGQAFNVGGGRPTSVLELMDTVQRLTGRPLNVERHDAPPGDVRRTAADISRTSLALDWSPMVPLQEGLEAQLRTVEDRLARGVYGGLTVGG